MLFIFLHIILPMLEWSLRCDFTIFLCTCIIKISLNMLKLLEMNINLWFLILKVALLNRKGGNFVSGCLQKNNIKLIIPKIIIVCKNFTRVPEMISLKLFHCVLSVTSAYVSYVLRHKIQTAFFVTIYKIN